MTHPQFPETDMFRALPVDGGVAAPDREWVHFSACVAEEVDAFFEAMTHTVQCSPGFPLLRSRVQAQVTGRVGGVENQGQRSRT